MTSGTPDLDRRLYAYRPDLADSALQNVVTAANYVEPQLRQCVRGLVPVYEAPDPHSRRLSEIRYGEFIDVFEQRPDGFAWVQNRADRTVGYIAFEGILNEQIADLSNRVCVMQTCVYAQPDVHAEILDRLTLGSYVSTGLVTGAFLELSSGGFIVAHHIQPTEQTIEPDIVFTAGRFLTTPYLAGGRSPCGIDSSGLLQMALTMAGIDAPRDADVQCSVLGHPLPTHWRDVAWKRGDIVFFADDVGIMTDHANVIHANTERYEITVEPLVDLVLKGHKIVATARMA